MKRNPKLARKGPRKPVPERNLRNEWNAGKDVPSTFHFPAKTRRAFDRRRARGFISSLENYPEYNDVKYIHDIVVFLQRKGVFVPRIKSIDYENELINFEKSGQSLDSTLSRIGSKEKRLSSGSKKLLAKLFSKLARAMARMHSAGVVHMHPHSSNIIVSGNKLGFVDFTRAIKTNPQLLWENPSIMGQDYIHVARLFSRLGKEFEHDKKWLGKQKNMFFSRMLRRYACSNETKTSIAKRLARIFRETTTTY